MLAGFTRNPMDTPPDLLPTRYSLLEKARSPRDGKAWEDLLGYYEPFINKILLHMGLRDEDLEDVRQQVMLKFWTGLKSYQRDANGARFRGWLSTLIRNTAIDWFRTRARECRPVALPDAPAPLTDDPVVERFIEEEWQRLILTQAVRNLNQIFSGKALKVLALSLQGETVEAIAERLDLRRESVYVLKTRVKTRLTQEIARLRHELEGEFP